METTIRKAGIDDVQDVAPLFNAYRVFYKQPEDLIGATVFLTERLMTNESVIFIAYADGIPVGFTQLYPIFSSVSMQRTWLLNDLFVDGACRGKGIGRALLNTAKVYGRSTNSKWLMLQTGKENFSAQALYEKDGWTKESDFFYTVTL